WEVGFGNNAARATLSLKGVTRHTRWPTIARCHCGYVQRETCNVKLSFFTGAATMTTQHANTVSAPSPVRLARDGDIAVIIIDNPPVNAGSRAVRAGLLEAVAAVAADDTVKAAVLMGANNTFIAGSDIKEFGAPLQEPQLPAVIAAIETCPKPVVAALQGAALGGGYELALGCDARVVAHQTVVGLPEVTLGMIPGA